jgi:outer membrane lipoprotein LolB
MALAVLLAGCATTPKGVDLPPIDSWAQRQAVLGAIEDWQFKGRIAVKAGDDGFNGKLNWSQAGEAFNASVSGPLGMGTVRLEGDGRAVVLTDNDGVRTDLQDAEQELYFRYGWTIPVASLRYWALGIPDPSRPGDSETDAEGRLTRLSQGDWIVEISRYAEGGGQSMPRIMTATNPDTRVRMVIDQWIFLDR